MKNRNKRFTSVLAASMALGMMAPAMVSVAPVMAAEQAGTAADYMPENAVYKGTATVNGITYEVYTNPNADVPVGAVNETYLAAIVDDAGYTASKITVDSNINITIDNVVYPSTVVAIGDNAFRSNNTLTKVTINGDADNPIAVGENAFLNCTKLETVVLNNVSELKPGAFQNVVTQEINGNDVTIGGVITSVTFTGDTTTAIGKKAFQNQPGLTSIKLPESLETIGEAAFEGTKLQGTIVLPDTLTSIAPDAFATMSGSLTLVWPTVNGKNANIATTGDIFNGDGSYKIEASSETQPAATDAKTWSYVVKAPNITPVIGGEAQAENMNKNIKASLGQSIGFQTEGTGTLEVDDKVVATYVNKGTHTYILTTPQMGTHTVKFTSSNGVSRTITVTVVTDGINMWLDKNLTVPTWTLGNTDVEPTGAVAKYGEVYYVYSTNPTGPWNTARPNYTGTWYVMAKVDATNDYDALSCGPVEFDVLPASDVNTGWVASGDNWMYKEDGEFVTSALKEIDGDTYLFDSEGVMVTGWAKNDTTNGNWMFFDNAGHAKKGWLNDNGTWYYLNSEAVMVANEWVKDGGQEYFLTDNGAMAVSRWLTKDGHDVYVDNSGALKKGWLGWNHNWYYLEPSTGYMATSGTVDGWNIQSNGIAVKA